MTTKMDILKPKDNFGSVKHRLSLRNETEKTEKELSDAKRNIGNYLKKAASYHYKLFCNSCSIRGWVNPFQSLSDFEENAVIPNLSLIRRKYLDWIESGMHHWYQPSFGRFPGTCKPTIKDFYWMTRKQNEDFGRKSEKAVKNNPFLGTKYREANGKLKTYWVACFLYPLNTSDRIQTGDLLFIFHSPSDAQKYIGGKRNASVSQITHTIMHLEGKIKNPPSEKRYKVMLQANLPKLIYDGGYLREIPGPYLAEKGTYITFRRVEPPGSYQMLF